jgi:hypothetical protein
MYTAQVLQICLFFGFCATLASTVRFQLWEKESQNAQVGISTFYSSAILF